MPAKKTVRPKGRATRAKRKVTPLFELASTWPFTTRKTMFGCDTLLAQGKLCVIEMDDALVLRVGREKVEAALKLRGAEVWNPWNPGQTNDWVSFPPPRRGIPQSMIDLARAAYELTLAKKPSPKKKTRRKPLPGGRLPRAFA
jgi:TfoX/Sxy family transcriptional regulator of competence genes